MLLPLLPARKGYNAASYFLHNEAIADTNYTDNSPPAGQLTRGAVVDGGDGGRGGGGGGRAAADQVDRRHDLILRPVNHHSLGLQHGHISMGLG